MLKMEKKGRVELDLELDLAIEAATKKLGYSEVREEQKHSIKAFLDGNDVFMCLPTGFGKSFCYFCLPVTFDLLQNQANPWSLEVVVSPLMALMEDQVKILQDKGISAVNISGVCAADEKIKKAVLEGKFQVIFASPELLLSNVDWSDVFQSPSFGERLIAIVIDEAHCVKKWGTTFRKQFSKIGDLRGFFHSSVKFMALTATASKSTRKEVIRLLGMVKPTVIVKCPEKPNVMHCVIKKKRELEEEFTPLVENLRANRRQTDKTIFSVGRMMIESMLNKTKDLEENTKEKQKEITILQNKISSLSCELIAVKEENKALKKEKSIIIAQFKELGKETGENIKIDTNNPSSKEASIKEETTNQPTQQQEYDPHAENITVSNSEIILTAPSLTTCKEVQIQDDVESISLHDAFADSASAILLRLPKTSITYLHINRTHLSHDSVHSIIDLLQVLKALRLTNVYLPFTSLSYILNALLTNDSLDKFSIDFDDQMMLPLSSTSAASYAQAISDVVRSNSTLQYFSALGLRFDEARVVKILHALANNNTTLRLLTLDQSHQATAYRFSESNGPIKDRLRFS